MPDTAPDPREAWFDLLSAHRWDHAVTLTTRYPLSRPQLEDQIVRYARKLARTAQHRIPWFAAFERTHDAGHWHAHLLIAGTLGIPHRKLTKAWTHGFTSVDTLQDARRAIRYAVKHLNNDPDSYALSRRWIRRPSEHRREAA